jgi:hypothetical protein
MAVLYDFPTMRTDKKAAERSARLRAIRERLHEMRSQRAFAAELGVPDTRYRNWENGKPIPSDEAKKIKDITPGVTGDYILWGDESGLRLDVLKKLKTNK